MSAGPVRSIHDVERRARLARRHHLARSARICDVLSLAGDLVGLHSSSPSTVYLAAFARTITPSFEELERALYEDRTLLRVLGMRRTLFVVPRDLAAIANAACTAKLAVGERTRLLGLIEKQGIAADAPAWLDGVEDETMAALRRRGQAFATELTGDVPALEKKVAFGEGTKWAGQVGMSTRVLFLLATEGKIVRGKPRGTWMSNQYRWVPMDLWIGGDLEQIPTAEARRELARRWLGRFGPATQADVQWWTGWTKTDSLKALREVGAVEVALDGGAGWVLPDDVDPVEETEPWAALLPALDPTVMGWTQRDWYLGEYRPVLFDTNGNAGPTVWWNGRIVGGWAHLAGGTIALRLLEDIGAEGVGAVEAEAARLEPLISAVKVIPLFRTPVERELSVRSE
ncbi:MAG TPA: winged helix DNA-binding domain-containing protein [Acidimicrobiia bacterium]